MVTLIQGHSQHDVLTSETDFWDHPQSEMSHKYSVILEAYGFLITLVLKQEK